MSYMSFLAGAAKRDITPVLDERPVYLAGFQNNRVATGIHTPLYARALALRLDELVCVLVACDLIGLGWVDVQEIHPLLAAHGIPPEALIVACTHTHSGPDTIGLWGPDRTVSGVDRAYLALVKQAIAGAAIEALTFCCPVHLRCSTTRLPGYVRNTRTPDQVDDDVVAVRFEKPDGEVVATLLNLACHPEVLWSDSTLLSADYAGVACQVVEERSGGMALHVSGALGGMLTPNTDDHSPAFVEQMGRAYAEAALEALARAEPHEAQRLLLRRTPLQLPMHNPIFQLAQQAGILRALPLDNDQLTTTCSYVDLGPVQMLAVPGEVLPGLGRELKALLPGPCRVLVGLADDELGYILPDDEFVAPADYLNPGTHYEESMSLGPRTGSLLLAAATALVKQAAPASSLA